MKSFTVAITVMLGCLVHPSFLQAQKATGVITGKAVPELVGLDSLISSFIETNGIPGASLAVAKDGKLIYARGFGFADLERRLPVQPQSLFRIASISKTITAAAIYKLVDDGKVNLSDKVYDLLKLKRYHALPFDERWKQITVQNLLDHKGGFDRGLSGDPMFKSLEITKALNVPAPARPEHVIRFMLSKKLDFSPNQRSEYSNFGYSLLGRVIEQASGKSYEKYVQDTLLHPIGIRGMKIGNTLTTAHGEVKYYDAKRSMGTPVFPGLGKQVPAPYGTWCLESMDSHGGWIASAPDLARFGSAFDQPDRFPAYGSPSLKGKFGPEYTFFGGLPGTSTVFRRTGKGITWVLLFNTNKEVDGKSPADIATPKVQDFLAKHTSWPTHDLFTAMQYDQKPAKK